MLEYLLSRLRLRQGGTRSPGRTAVCVRTLAATALLVGAPAGWPLGLGDIELESSLNEKLEAEIELLDAAGLQPTEVLVSLASAEDFERVGVERFFFLTDLRFEVTYDADGVGNIKVTSTQPVTEPYLNFLVEVLWPNGRLLKEYTLLLDPPTFSPAPAPTVSAPARSSASESGVGRVERQATVSRGTQVQMPSRPRSTEPSPLDEGIVDGEYRMTDRRDTLWSIASRTRPSNRVSVQQTMLAIQRLNQEAFLHGNINLLKAGYSLRLPSEAQALEVSTTEANQQVALQTEDWRALQRGEQPRRQAERRVAGAEQPEPTLQSPVDATPAGEPRVIPAAAQGGELKIVAAVGDGVAGGTAADADLDAALEERDRLGREVDALTEALDREKELASNQISVKDRQLEVKDQQIAELQAQVQRLREEMERAQAAAVNQSQNQNASSETRAWWQSPYVLIVALGIVVLLLVYALIAARRRRAEEEDEFFADTVAEPEPAPAAAAPAAGAGAAAAATIPDLDAEVDDDADAEPRAMDPDDDAVGALDSETGDVIGEADIYIAYGRYPQAISLLLGVLDEDPERNDVRLKLLELYAETRDRTAFDAHLAELVERCDDEEALLTARELAQQFAAGADGVDGADAAPEPAAQSLEEAPVADADDSVLDSRDASGELALEAMPAAGESAEDTELTALANGADDFELELDEIVTEATEPRSDDALGGDLGFEFDPDAEPSEAQLDEAPQEAATVALASEEIDLDLDLDLDLDEAEPLADEAFDFDDEGDTASTKLDLARAYIDMGDQDGARDILNEVLTEGNSEQQQRAQAMLEEI